MRIFWLILSLVISFSAFGEDLPVPTLNQNLDTNKGMVWNKWETENFIVLSIDFEYGKRLKSSVEDVKFEFYNSWGLSDDKFPVKCKIICVPNQATLKKFFSLDEPRQEIKKDSAGTITDVVIWMDESRSDQLVGLIASVSLYDRPPFIRRGVSKIVSSTPSKTSELILSSASSPNSVWKTSEDEIRKFSPSEVLSLDANSVVACLFLRKEFGLSLFSRIIAKNGADPQIVCGFKDEKSLESTLDRYSENLKSDLKSGKTPDSYLVP